MLDEATASLDTITENSVQVALDRLGAQRTVLVIAHRLGTSTLYFIVFAFILATFCNSHKHVNINFSLSYLPAEIELLYTQQYGMLIRLLY